MRSHWVLLVVNLAVLSAGSLALVIGYAIAVKRITGASLGTWPLLCIFLAVSGPLFYAALRVVKPDRMIRRLMDR